jgi:hypothetical protein
LADVIERIEFDQQVVHRALWAFYQSETVMPRINVQEVGRDWTTDEVADAKTKQITIEGEGHVDAWDHEQYVAHAQWAGAEAGNVAPGPEWRIGHLRTVERFQPVADRISKGDQAAHAALISTCYLFPPHRHVRRLQACGERFQRGSVGDFPAEDAVPLGHRGVDDQALLSVVHTEGTHATAAVDGLHAKDTTSEVRGVSGDTLQVRGCPIQALTPASSIRSERSA